MRTVRSWAICALFAPFCLNAHGQGAAPAQSPTSGQKSPTSGQTSGPAATPAKVNIHIQGLPIDEALRQFGEQTGLQVLFRSEAVPTQGITSHPVSGELSPREALEQLLTSTGLTYEFINPRTVRVSPGRPTSPNRPTSDNGRGSSGARNAAATHHADRPSNSGEELQEIVVTANKRPESAQNVAAAVTVERGVDLVARGQSSLADYANNVPGLAVSSLGAPGLTSVTIRGISTLNSTSAVGTYLDDTPIGSSTGWANGYLTLLDMLPYDLDQVEVLRGPQGTLYGADAMGGLIKYALKAPSTTQLDGNIGAEAISVDGAGQVGYAVRGRVSVPLIDNVLGVSLSAADRVTPGYMTNDFTGETHTNRDEQYSLRLAVLWQPMQDLSVKLNALTQRIEARDVAVRQFAGTTSVPSSDGAVIVAPTNPLPALHDNFAFLAPYDQRIDYYSGTLDWNPGPFDLVAASSWSSQHSVEQFDYTQQLGSILNELGGAAPGLARISGDFGLDKFTQEVRLVSPQDQQFEWMAGVFVTHENSFNTQDIIPYSTAYQPVAPTFPPGLYLVNIPEIFDEYAGFANLTWKLSQAFDVTGGVRYAHNDQDFNIYQAPGPLVSESGRFHVGTHESVTTWLGSAQYHFDPHTMVYARVATGYRPGGPNTPLTGVPATVASDSLINYELGVKSTVLGGRVHVEADIYHIDWKNIQLTALAPNGVSYLANGGKSISQGIEFAGQFQPVEHLSIGVNAAYNDAHLTSVVSDASFLQTGYQLPNAPKETVSTTINYDLALAPDWVARIGGGFRYVGWQWLGLVESASNATTPTVRAGGYGAVDLNADVRHHGLTVSLYARNLANRLAISGASQQNLVVVNSATGATQINTAFLQPRTVGVAVDYAF